MATESTKTEVGSYFISNYPPFSQWKNDQLDEVTKAMALPPVPDTPLGLYLHIPFCRKRCKFCYFKVFTDQNAKEIEKYVAALCHEIELVSKLPVMGDRPFRFVYFGGGTPSFLSSRQLTSLVDRLRANINWDQAEEVTFECEPGTLQESKIKTLKELGITRLSLGIENFTDSVLEENGRAHLSKEVYKSWDWIKAADFDNVNIDLISGMVGETWDNWKYNISEAIKLSPESITIYQMELPFNTVYSKDILGEKIETPVADWETKRAWLDYAYEEFLGAGYKISSAYTVVKDNNKVNFSYRDNLWQGSDLLATGIASFGHVSGVHYQNKADMKEYQADLMEHNRLPLGRALKPTPHQLLVREMILLLKRGFLDVGYFKNKYNVDITAHWKNEFEQHAQDGMLVIGPERIELTRKGFLHADAMLPPFFEAEHQGIRYT
ncbi:MAG: oxygen-independent coproporphyrinogen-3 oxidase [Mariniblastus sp.]|jgi:oxygen-independent coproporphyrinogen-3 oxidase